MRLNKSILIGLSCSVILILAGCGSDSGDSTTSSISSSSSSSSSSLISSSSSSVASNTITVVDGYIIQATVKNGDGQIIGQTNGSGKVDSQGVTLKYPLHAIGGYIDVNMNGQVDVEDIQVPTYMELLTDRGTVISPLTTLVAMGADSEKLALLAGLPDVNEIYTDPLMSNNVDLEKLNQIAYVLLASNTARTFIYSVNNMGEGDLPNFAGNSSSSVAIGGLDAFVQMAYKAALNNQTALDTIQYIANLQVTDAASIESAVKPLKTSIIPTSDGGVGGGSTGGGFVTSSVSNSVVSSFSSVSSFISSSVNTSVSNNGDLPNLNDHSNIIQSSSSIPSDLPNLVTSASSSSVSSFISSSSSSINNSASGDIPSFSY